MNNSKKIIYLFLIICITSVFSGCSTVPYSGRSQFIITSEEQENTLGEKAWEQVKEQNKISNNKIYNAALKRVAENITSNLPELNYKWEFAVFNSPNANAFCLPGGKIAVYSAFFNILTNDGELAAIVGHEIAHALARHAGERISHQEAADIGGQTVSQILSQEVSVPIPWMQVLGVASTYGVILPYSRTQEYEADYIGMILMAKGGYDPHAAVELWKKFAKESNYDSLTEFFMTHPMGEKRLKEIEDNLPDAMKYYNDAKIKHGLGETYNFNKKSKHKD